MARTLVRGSTQVMGESIYDAQIAADAEIQLSKIENWEDIVTTSGTVNGDIDMGTNQIKNVAPGTDPNDVVTKAQLDSISAGLDPKESVRVATTGNIDLDAIQTIDGVSLAVGDRVLVKDQTDPIENGIYTVSAGAWPRSEDADGATGEVSGGMFTFVEHGTDGKGTGWVVVADGTLTPDTSPIGFTQFAGGGAITGGLGINIAGTTVTADVDNSTLINTAGGGDKIGVKALGITALELAADAVITSKVLDSNITAIKVASDIAGVGLTKNAGSHALDVNVDGTTITISGTDLAVANSGIDTIQLNDGAVTLDKLAGAVAGDGIIATGGGLAVNADNVTLEIATDVLRIKAAGVGTNELADNSLTKEKLNADVAGVALDQAVGGELDVQVDNNTVKVNGSNELYVDTSVMLSVANYVVREKPTVDTQGQTVVTLANAPVTGTEMVYVNGVLMDEGAGNDYTISGATITFEFGLDYHASNANKRDKVLVTYFK